jgi:hypothetical protein
MSSANPEVRDGGREFIDSKYPCQAKESLDAAAEAPLASPVVTRLKKRVSQCWKHLQK